MIQDSFSSTLPTPVTPVNPTVPVTPSPSSFGAKVADVGSDARSQAAKWAGDVFNRGQSKNRDMSLEHVANTSQQFFGAGNTQSMEDLLPGFVVNWMKKSGTWFTGKADTASKLARPAGFFHEFPSEHPTALSRLKTAGRWLGPVVATASLAYSIENLATNWKNLTPGAKVANVAATGFTAAGAGAAFAALSHAPWAAAAGTVAWGGLGAASAIYQGIQTWQYFNNPKATSGQRGLSLVSTIMQGAGAALIFTPVGLPLLAAGGIIGMLCGPLGKFGPINSAFKWMGKELKPVTRFLAPVGHAITQAAGAVVHGLGSAAHAVGHFFSSIF